MPKSRCRRCGRRTRCRRWPQDAGTALRPPSDPERLNAGYVLRSQHVLSRQRDREPSTYLLEHAQERELRPEAELDDGSLTYFTSRHKAEHVTCRLVVRRVKRLNPTAHTGQGELFDTYRHHGFITNSTLCTIEADQSHRDHAVIEQVIAELKDGPVAHLPSSSYPANAAWVAHAVIAFNLARAAGVAGSPRHARARRATIRTQLINVPARIASSSRRLTLHLPQAWPWAQAWTTLNAVATGPPAPVTS